jgi:hypothetical protein
LGLAAGVNPYQYATNTWSWIDPLGLCKKRGRPATGSSGNNVPIASDYIKNKRNIGRSNLAKDFYSVPNQAGGRVYVSKIPIAQEDFSGLVNKVNAKGNVKVLTGTHGDYDGNLIPEVDFFHEDFASWGNKTGIEVIDITKLSDAEIANVVNSPGRTVCAWCLSERSTAVLNGLGFTP